MTGVNERQVIQEKSDCTTDVDLSEEEGMLGRVEA
jgi:hypothetical protein